MAEGSGKIAPLAAQYLAQTQYEGGGDANGATRTLSAVAAVEGSPYERLSILKTAYFSVDTQSMADLEATLGSLVEDEGPLGALARELIAAKAFESGDIARARTEFNRLRFDAAAPEGVKRRAEIALAAIPPAPAEETTASDTETPVEGEAPAETADIEETGQ